MFVYFEVSYKRNILLWVQTCSSIHSGAFRLYSFTFVGVNPCRCFFMWGINHHDMKGQGGFQLNTLQPVMVGPRMASLASQLMSGKLISFNKIQRRLGFAVKIVTICLKSCPKKTGKNCNSVAAQTVWKQRLWQMHRRRIRRRRRAIGRF